MNSDNQNVCVSCSNPFSGKYCNQCGEKVLQREEHSLRYFLGEVVSAFTFADSKAWRTFKMLLLRPGLLPLRYVNGQRKSFIPPLSLFLLINILYFFFTPLDTFNSYFPNQIGGQPYSRFIKEYALETVAESGLARDSFEAKYNAHSANTSKSIILLFPVLFAFALWGLFYRQSSFVFDHLMFSISFMSFVLLVVFLLLPYAVLGVLYLLAWLGRPVSYNWNGASATAMLFIAVFSYLGIGLKNFYRQHTGLILLKTILLLFSLTILLFVYRGLLFFLTIWTL